MSKFFMFDQNNSGGHFVVDKNLCHRIVFECESENEAIFLAENKGCYWNGVDDGVDCPCCGDRWSTYCNEIDIDKYSTEGYPVSV